MPRTNESQLSSIVMLLAALLLSAIIYLLVFRTGLLASAGPLRNGIATLLASLPYLLACWSRRQESDSRLQLVVAIFGAVALRLCMPLDLLEGTDDAYRYLWDGRVLDHGINPYSYPPVAVELSALRDGIFFDSIYRPEMRTVYPPLAQLWFWVSYRLCPTGFAGWKLVLLAHEMATIWLLSLLAARRWGSSAAPVVYAWSPLVVVQLFSGAHLDGLAAPWLLLSLFFTHRRRPLWAGASLAAAAMVRPVLGLGLFPLLVAHAGARLSLLGGASATGVLLLLPFASARGGLFESLLVYARHWRFNGFAFRLLEAVFGRGALARWVAYTAAVALALASALWVKTTAIAMALAIGGYYLLSPTIYPWYMVPIVALGSVSPRPWLLALPAATSLSDLVYLEKLRSGRWQVPAPALFVEHLSILGLLLLELRRNILAQRRKQEVRT